MFLLQTKREHTKFVLDEVEMRTLLSESKHQTQMPHRNMRKRTDHNVFGL